MRYTANGADETTIEVPSGNTWMKDGYSTFPLTKRHRVWADKANKFNFGNHVIGLMLNDDDFVRSYVPTWALKSLRKYTSNLYVFFYNGEGGEETPEPKEPTAKTKRAKKAKKERKPREKKVNPEKEKKMTFKALRNKLNGKIKLTKALHHWTDPAKLEYYGSSRQNEKDNFEKVVLNIFKSYKTYFEELLTLRNIPFYIAAENYEVHDNNGSGDLTIEYVLVNNTENVPVPTLNKQDWKKITLAWMTSTKVLDRESRWNRHYEKNLCIKKIGLANGEGRLRKSDVKSFKSMRETSFAEMTAKALEENTNRYAAKIEDFKALKGRAANNKEQEKELKDFITANIIPHVDVEYLDGNALDFSDKPFRVIFGKDNYRSIEFLDISTSTDDVENLTINVEFFGNKTARVATASEAIAVVNKVFGNKDELQTVVDVFKKAWTVR
jgi:hypothetical protein